MRRSFLHSERERTSKLRLQVEEILHRHLHNLLTVSVLLSIK